ncbi:hypothetical protein FALBO_198 [Fusarium albosuccineum]|uniref:Uncharacterized protein n=1 Tax=Fusarium albosuccineum TaxID=1237068 RepID=A0A8H4PJ48_9HYPO|nr:hypothetical protein FALBO_198 [Fusarium albosuccineum]
MPAAANNPGNQAWKPSADEQKETSVAWALAARKDAKDSLAEIQAQIKDLEKEKKSYLVRIEFRKKLVIPMRALPVTVVYSELQWSTEESPRTPGPSRSYWEARPGEAIGAEYDGHIFHRQLTLTQRPSEVFAASPLHNPAKNTFNPKQLRPPTASTNDRDTARRSPARPKSSVILGDSSKRRQAPDRQCQAPDRSDARTAPTIDGTTSIATTHRPWRSSSQKPLPDLPGPTPDIRQCSRCMQGKLLAHFVNLKNKDRLVGKCMACRVRQGAPLLDRILPQAVCQKPSVSYTPNVRFQSTRNANPQVQTAAHLSTLLPRPHPPPEPQLDPSLKRRIEPHSRETPAHNASGRRLLIVETHTELAKSPIQDRRSRNFFIPDPRSLEQLPQALW